MNSTTIDVNKKKKGFTLVEMLATLIIVVLFTMMLTTFIDLTVEHFNNSVKNADAQTLASTLTNAVEDELRYATDITVDEEGNYKYFSTSLGLGKNCVIKNVVKNINGENRNILVVDNDRMSEYPLINHGSYVYDLNAYITATYTNDIFNVSISIKDRNEKEICKSDFAVVPLNPNTMN